MDTRRIESFKQFAKYLEYPMVVFEAESGNVLDINYEAEVLLGGKAKTIRIEPGRALTKNSFWDVLHGKKSLIWHRIRMLADDKEFLVSGLINEMIEADTRIYTLLFERRADLNIGSLTLERIVNHAGIVAVHMGKTRESEIDFQVEYVSQNINHYGYTRGQLYEKLIQFSDIICAEDFERIRNIIRESVQRRTAEDVLECRFLTEERDLIPVRLLVRYIYNDYGNLTDIEILIIDLREEQRRNQENSYLSNAITKMRSVVIVKSYQAGKRPLRYISPNAGMVGMNVEALRKGYKLTEDYIHPEDRDSVLDAIYQAVANGVTDYVQIYRMVRDDGKQIWVENEVTVNRISDGEAEISFLITDITEQKDIEREMVATQEIEEAVPETTSSHSMSMITIDADDTDMLFEFQMMADTLCKNANYYSVVIDSEGRQLTRPAGPAHDMGLFYDMFERPLFKQEFATISEQAKEKHSPQSVTFDMDSVKVHMVFAPLMLENVVTAYWVLTSFASDGAKVLSDIAENQWHFANAIAKGFYSREMVQKETKIRKLTEMQLHKEQAERRVIEDIIESMSRDGQAALSEMCYKIALYLQVQNIAIYLKNKETKNVEKYFTWNHVGDDVPFFDTMELSKAEYDTLRELFADQPLIVAGKQTTQPFLQEMVKQTNMSVLVHEVVTATGVEGYVVYADESLSREFDNVDTHFATSVTRIIESLIGNRHNIEKPDVIKTGLLESYDHLRDAVYVKDNRTGEIIFANKAMDKLFGYSLVGMRATDIINDQMEHYRNIGGVRKRFIDNKKVTKWQTYMKELDQIMNIVEVHMETLYGADWSLFILKRNKNKKT